jgi:cell division protein FtsB
MEWGTITTLVAEVLFGGGLLAFVTIKDKKTAAILENMQKVIEELRDLVREYKEENKSLKEEIKHKDEIIRGKEDYIRELHKEKSDLHEKLDKDVMVLGWSVEWYGIDFQLLDATLASEEDMLLRWKPSDFWYPYTTVYKRETEL